MTSSFTWGECRAADRVMAQVSGLRPSKALSRRFMVMQAYIDESFNPNGIFVLGGYIASAESWAKFSREWEALLPTATRDKSGKKNFKMSEMAAQVHVGRVEPFFRVIENNVLGWVSVKIDQAELKRAIQRIFVPGIKLDWTKHANAYYMAFRFLMDKFHLERPNMLAALPLEDVIDFYFDDRKEKKTILKMWDGYMQERPPEIKKLYGATPRFESDADFLPLQAADFWVWHVRKWHTDGTPEKIRNCEFDNFRLFGEKKFLRVECNVDEDDLVQTLVKIARRAVPMNCPIFVLPASSQE